MNKHIQFIYETQTNNKLNFLDFTITTVNKRFNLSIYRKSTQTNTIIPNERNPQLSLILKRFLF